MKNLTNASSPEFYRYGYKKKPVKINGVVYDSYIEASLSLDITKVKIREGVKALSKTGLSEATITVQRVEKLVFGKIKEGN